MGEKRLHNCYQGEDYGEKKSANADETTIASQNLTTSFAQFGSDHYDVGNNTVLAVEIPWTYASGTTLSVALKWRSMDGSTWGWVPSFAAPSSGVSAASVASCTFSSTTFDRNGTIADCLAVFNVPEGRRYQVWIKSNNASGSATGYVYGGRGS